MNDKDTASRAAQLMRPIEQQILMCDSREDALLFACAMLERAKTILEAHIGEDGRRQLFIMGNERLRATIYLLTIKHLLPPVDMPDGLKMKVVVRLGARQ